MVFRNRAKWDWRTYGPRGEAGVGGGAAVLKPPLQREILKTQIL